MPTNAFHTNSGYTFLFAAGSSWWLYLLLCLLAITCMYIFFKLRMQHLQHQKADVERQLLERTELLEYAQRDHLRAREDADQANRNKSVFLSKLSHEIRTPMNGVLGMTELLNNTLLNDEQRKYTNTILNSGTRLLTVINDILMKDILEYSKIDSGKALDMKDFELRNSVEEVLDVFASKAASAGLDLVYHINHNVPSQVVGDSMLLRQVLMNLVDNAFRFTKTGELFIGVSLLSNEADQVRIGFEVRDTGNGIPAEKLTAIQHDLYSQSAINGTQIIGHTLLICKKIVALMGGKLRVDSVVNQGTTFTFSIAAGMSYQRLHPTVLPEMADLHGKRILIVDDNISVRNTLKTQLENWNLAASIAPSGPRGLDAMDWGNGFDLVLVDMQMPGMSGIAFAQAVHDRYPGTPVILMNNGDETHRDHLSLFASVISKPIKQHVLQNQLLSGLRHKLSVDGSENTTVKNMIDETFTQSFPLNILVAEDDAINQLWVKTVLGKLGYDPHIAANGKEVLEVITHKDFDLILMDVQMPEMDGLESTRMIRLCIANQPVIIAMTANSLQGDREECLRAGMDDYISKPLNVEELANMLEKWYHSIHKQTIPAVRV